MDLILCRNVAIYYSEEVVREVVGRFYQCLVPGGWLMMGAAETSIPVFDQYAYHVFSGGTVYGKLNGPVDKPECFSYRPVEEETLRAPDPIHLPQSNVFRTPVIDLPPVIEDLTTLAAEPHAESPIPPDEQDFMEQGIDLVRRKRYEEAKDVFLRCIALNPRDAESFYQLGRVHANIGQMEAAQSFCEQAIEINPLKAEVYYTLGLIHQESGDNKGAMERLKRSLFLEPDFALAHVSMAILYGQLNQKEKSERHRRQAIELAAALAPETVLPGTDDLTARTLLTMAKTLK
jgi:chemotaxis protein methyltransferase CheR